MLEQAAAALVAIGKSVVALRDIATLVRPDVDGEPGQVGASDMIGDVERRLREADEALHQILPPSSKGEFDFDLQRGHIRL